MRILVILLSIISLPVFGQTKGKDTVGLLYLKGFKQPKFPGGDSAMNKFIASVFKYPENSKYKGVDDGSELTFYVNVDGRISDVKISHQVKGCEACDIEALRILKLMPKWEPGQEYNKAVRMCTWIKIPFKYLK